MSWQKNRTELNSLLTNLSTRDQDGLDLDQDEGFERWVQMALKVRREKKTVFLIGNGASASMASHMAADLLKNAHLRTELFYDLSLLTAIGNDLDFTDVFSEPLRIKMTSGDMVVAISSSGESLNIIKATKLARSLGGHVVSLSAINQGNSLRKEGDINFYISAATYGWAETCHAAILHYWMDLMAEQTLA